MLAMAGPDQPLGRGAQMSPRLHVSGLPVPLESELSVPELVDPDVSVVPAPVPPEEEVAVVSPELSQGMSPVERVVVTAPVVASTEDVPVDVGGEPWPGPVSVPVSASGLKHAAALKASKVQRRFVTGQMMLTAAAKYNRGTSPRTGPSTAGRFN